MIDVFELARYGAALPAPALAQSPFEASLAALARTYSDWLADEQSPKSVEGHSAGHSAVSFTHPPA